MSRWFAMLKRVQPEIACVQNVQIVQNKEGQTSFEHFEQFEQPTAIKTTSIVFKTDPAAFEECAALIETNGVPKEWAEGFAALCTMSATRGLYIQTLGADVK